MQDGCVSPVTFQAAMVASCILATRKVNVGRSGFLK
jgi:hypothetical protein